MGRRNLATTTSTSCVGSGNKKKKKTKARTNTVGSLNDDKRIVAKPISPTSLDSASETASTARAMPTMSSPTPCSILDDLGRLIQQLQSANTRDYKLDVLSRFASLAPILQWTYDPYRQFHVKTPQVIKYALAKASALSSTVPESQDGVVESYRRLWEEGGVAFETLDDLLEALSTRAVTGHRAKDSIMLFLYRFCREEKEEKSSFAPRQLSPSSSSGSSEASLEAYTANLLQAPRSQTFFKVLDKNLKAGVSVGFISNVFPGLIPRFHVALGHSLLDLDDGRKLFSISPSPQENNNTSLALDVAAPEGTMGKSTRRTRKKKNGTSTLSTTVTTEDSAVATAAWFGSRKLDGVRCLISINLATGEAEAVSRTGRPFETLNGIEAAVTEMIGGDSLEKRTKFFAAVIGEAVTPNSDTATATASTVQSPEGTGKVAKTGSPSLPSTLILDGEICVLDASQMTRAPSSNTIKGQVGREEQGEGPFDFDHGGIGQENFSTTIGYVLRSASASSPQPGGSRKKRHKSGDDNREEDDNDDREDPLKSLTNIRQESFNFQPVYCIFDCLTEQEFRDRKGTRPFSERIQGLWRAMSSYRGSSSAPSLDSSNNKNTIRILAQHRLDSFEQLEQMVAQSLERGWEGVMLRKNVGYEGRRSRNLLKIKKFQDAEFIVEEVMTGNMYLPDPVTAQFGEREVLTNVVVRHKGTRVRVGSGFSVEDRIRYGQRPELLVGKKITVQYFEESTSNRASSPSPPPSSSSLLSESENAAVQDDGGTVSLRFPTVKAIYESGEREL